MNVNETKTAISTAQQLKRTLHIIGAHGTGKSAIVYEWAKENGYTVVEKRLGLIADPGDLTGLPDHDRDKSGKAFATRFITPDWFPRNGKTVLFLDEVNRAHKDILQAIFELVYDRRLNGVALPDDVVIVAASNPPGGDYHVLDFNDPAFQDRFVHVAFTPTEEDFLSYCRNKGLNGEIVQFLNENRNAIRGKASTPVVNLDFVQPTQRSWEAVAQLRDLKCSNSNVEKEMVIGLVGTNEFYRLSQWLETQEKMPSAKEILSGFSKYKKLVQKVVEEGRNDIVGSIGDDLLAHINAQPETEQLTAAELKNLVAFLMELGDENLFGFLQCFVNGSKAWIPGADPDTREAHPLLNDAKLTKRMVDMKDKLNEFRNKVKQDAQPTT